MKAAVLYSGGKDSSFVAVMLERLGLDVELYTANFGVYDSYIPARKSAESLGFKHNVLEMDTDILKKTCEKILEDGFPNVQRLMILLQTGQDVMTEPQNFQSIR